jgi:ABC-type uncharacterized transport system permease subunit
MIATVSTLATIAFYLLSMVLLFSAIKAKLLPVKPSFYGLFIGAIITHTLSIDANLFANNQLNLSFYHASSLIFLAISIISLMSLLQKQAIENLVLLLLPSAALSATLSQFAPSPVKIIDGHGLISHIILSLLAYSIITLAALQALLLAVQEKLLRRHQLNGIFNYLPPLVTMESLLFRMIWIGFALLSASIVSGFFFLNDMFAQHLAHKTILSIIAWLVFAILLIGRHIAGWRGQTAAKWTIAGFIALMLAYFGSKFVLEMVLNRV